MTRYVDDFLQELLVVPISGDGKMPLVGFSGEEGGWRNDPVPRGEQAYWDHENTVAVGDGLDYGPHELVERLEEKGVGAGVIDARGEGVRGNLCFLDIDAVDNPEEADPADGRWYDRDAMWDFVGSITDGTTYETPGDGAHVPVLLTDEAYEAIFNNEYKAGQGVESLKGPAAKGYVKSPFSEGYEVRDAEGRAPVLDVDDLEAMDCFEYSETSQMQRISSAEPGDYEPSVPREEAQGTGETDDIGVMLSAINQLHPGQWDAPFDYAGDRGDGTLMYDPPHRHSETGESFVFLEDREIWYDQSADKGMFSDKAVALDMGLISDPHQKLSGKDWWKAVEKLRELGAPVPEWTGPEPSWYADLDEHDALDEGGDEALLWELRRDYAAQHEAAVEEGVSGHLVGPKGVGKTHNVLETAKEHKTLVCAPTKEKYDEILALAETLGVSALRLPSFPEHSPLFDDWESEYERGAYPRELYTWDDRDPEDIPDDEYKARQDEDFDDYDLLVGSPAHAFVESVREGRRVFFDDAELDAYRDVLDRSTKDEMNAVLERISCAANSWKDLHRTDWSTIERALIRHLDNSSPTGSTVGEALQNATEGPDELDRRAFLARLPGVSLDVIDWMRALTGHLHSSDAYEDRGMRLQQVEDEYLLVRAPDMSSAEQVFTMGAWPAEGLEQMFEDMNIEFDGMYGSARHGEMERAINRYVIQTSEHVHNKSSDYAAPERIEALAESLEELGAQYGVEENAHIFSTKHEANGVADGRGEELDESELVENYGSLIGTNKHSEEHLAVAGASQHYGDDFVKVRAAFAGVAPEEPSAAAPFEPRRWEDETHRRIEERMRRSGMYEAITRMGRSDTELTMVAADSAELPEWLQVVDQSDKVGYLSPSAEALYEHIRETDGVVFVKDGEGGGAVEELSYSGPQLYSARDELLEAGLIEKAAEGKYGSEGFEETEVEPGNRGIMGLNRSQLPGSSFRGARNPDWDVERFETASADAPDASQTVITSAQWTP